MIISLLFVLHCLLIHRVTVADGHLLLEDMGHSGEESVLFLNPVYLKQYFYYFVERFIHSILILFPSHILQDPPLSPPHSIPQLLFCPLY